MLNRRCWCFRLTEAPRKTYHVTVEHDEACNGLQVYHTQFIELWGEGWEVGNESRLYTSSYIWLLLSPKLFYLRMKGHTIN